jgi:hypothetical protein
MCTVKLYYKSSYICAKINILTMTHVGTSKTKKKYKVFKNLVYILLQKQNHQVSKLN